MWSAKGWRPKYLRGCTRPMTVDSGCGAPTCSDTREATSNVPPRPVGLNRSVGRWSVRRGGGVHERRLLASSLCLLALVLSACASASSQRLPAYEPYVFPVLECRLVRAEEYVMVVRSNRTWWIVDQTLSDHDKNKVQVGTWRALDQSVLQFRRYGSRRPTGYLRCDLSDRSGTTWAFSRDQGFQRSTRLVVSDPSEVHILWNALSPVKDRLALAAR